MNLDTRFTCMRKNKERGKSIYANDAKMMQILWNKYI